MSKQLFLPESMYEIDSKMNYGKIKTFHKSKTTITAKVIRLNSKSKVLEVDLGGDLKGILPLEEATIYSIYKYDNSFSRNIIGLIGKTIQAKIINIKDDIIISRKENMLQVLEHIKKQTGIIQASITGMSRASVYLDIGAGIAGKCTFNAISQVVFHDTNDLGFKKAQIIPVKILEFKDDINCFDLSFVDTFENINDALNVNDVVICKVFNALNDGIGYYVLIDNKYAGIIDSPNVKLNYGDEVSAVIHKITDKGPKLRLVEKL